MIWLFKGFADIVITDDITAGQENWYFTESGPHTLYMLYSMASYVASKAVPIQHFSNSIPIRIYIYTNSDNKFYPNNII